MNHHVVAWLGMGFLGAVITYAVIIIFRDVRNNPPRRAPKAGIVPLIYVGVIELNLLQEAIFYAA